MNNKNKIKICFVNPKKSGIGYHRLEIPFSNIATVSNDIFDITSTNGFTNEFNPGKFDIIVLNRLMMQDEDWLLRAKEMGVKIILDLDDWIYLPEWHHARHNNYYPEIEKRIISAINHADVIWSASEKMKSLLINEFPGKEVIYVPNAIDFTQKQFIPLDKKDYTRHNKYTIGYIGASNHHMDLSLVAQSFADMYNPKYRGKYAILLAGISDTSNNTSNYWSNIIGIMTSNGYLPHEDFISINATDAYNYAFSYNMVDLLIAPLYKDTFTECKSNIKILEAGAFSKPIICSNVEPYKEFISKGLVYTSDKDWSKHMGELVLNPEKGIKLGKRLHEYVREHYDIDVVNIIREDSLIELFEK